MRIISYTGGFVHQCTAADVIINPSAPFSAGGVVVVVVVCRRKRKGKNKIKKERSSGDGKETETSLGGVGWGSGGGPYGWIRFFLCPPNRFCYVTGSAHILIALVRFRS